MDRSRLDGVVQARRRLWIAWLGFVLAAIGLATEATPYLLPTLTEASELPVPGLIATLVGLGLVATGLSLH
jgi:hypothetical protein